MHTALTDGHRSCTCGPKTLYGSESFEPAEGFSLTFRFGLALWWTVCPLTNCHYFTSSSEFTSFFLTAWLSIISRVTGITACNNKWFSLHQCKGHTGIFYLLILFFFPFFCLFNHQTCFSLVCVRAFTALSYLTVKWSRKPISVPFHRGDCSWISTRGSTGCSLLFPLKVDRNVSWFLGIENGSISSHWVLLV